MSENYLQKDNILNKKKGFFNLMLHQLFCGEPKNHNDILDFIKDFEKKNLININTRDMLKGVMNILNQKVKDIMTPRSQMFILKKKYSLQKCIDIIIKSSRSRFPVISNSKDYVEGILLTKDILPCILNYKNNFSIDNILRPAVIIPENKRVDSMLKEFCSKHYHISIVVNEFGSVSGLITIKDILELIVGKIEDEYNLEDNKNIRQLNKNVFSICGLTTIESYNKFFNAKFNDQEVDTIGGLVMQAFGHLPSNGEIIDIDNYTFKVTITNNHRIIQVHVTIPDNLLQFISQD